MDKTAVIDKVLDMARWAPSGDNTQPWRFERLSSHEALIHVQDTRHHCVYDLDGRPTELAAGALIETASIAARQLGYRCDYSLDEDIDPSRFRITLKLLDDSSTRPSPLFDAIRSRSTFRRPLSPRSLSQLEKNELAASVAPDFTIHWKSSLGERLKMASLNFQSARLRLTIREAWEVHRSVIDWNADFSEDKIPDRATGTDPLMRAVMRWVLQDWGRVQFMNRYLAGTIAPRIELDWLPAVLCAGHFALVGKRPVVTRQDHLAAGRAMQSVWLTAEKLGLRMQPEMTPVIFARYARESRFFSSAAHAPALAARVNDLLLQRFGMTARDNTVFLARIGAGTPAGSRSLRLPLEKLGLKNDAA